MCLYVGLFSTTILAHMLFLSCHVYERFIAENIGVYSTAQMQSGLLEVVTTQIVTCDTGVMSYERNKQTFIRLLLDFLLRAGVFFNCDIWRSELVITKLLTIFLSAGCFLKINLRMKSYI